MVPRLWSNAVVTKHHVEPLSVVVNKLINDEAVNKAIEKVRLILNTYSCCNWKLILGTSRPFHWGLSKGNAINGKKQPLLLQADRQHVM